MENPFRKPKKFCHFCHQLIIIECHDRSVNFSVLNVACLKYLFASRMQTVDFVLFCLASCGISPIVLCSYGDFWTTKAINSKATLLFGSWIRRNDKNTSPKWSCICCQCWKIWKNRLCPGFWIQMLLYKISLVNISGQTPKTKDKSTTTMIILHLLVRLNGKNCEIITIVYLFNGK